MNTKEVIELLEKDKLLDEAIIKSYVALLKRGEKYKEIFKELKIYCSVLERHDILKEIIRLELKYFPKGGQ